MTPAQREALLKRTEQYDDDRQQEVFRALAEATTSEEIVELIGDRLYEVGSEDRLSHLLTYVHEVNFDARVFWPLFQRFWTICDNTWHLRDGLLDWLRLYELEASPELFFSTEERAFFDSLPDRVKVYRGCSAPHHLGISWTTDKNVAAGFAKGHRGIPVRQPMLYEAVVPKEAIFTVFTERGEFEVVLDPERLTDSKSYTVHVDKAARILRSNDDLLHFAFRRYRKDDPSRLAPSRVASEITGEPGSRRVEINNTYGNLLVYRETTTGRLFEEKRAT